MAARSVIATFALTVGLATASWATTWHDGDMVTYTQADWGDIPNGSNIASTLVANYNDVYASTFDVFALGDLAGYLVTFNGYDTLLVFLPQVGPVGPFDSSLMDPLSSSAGAFAGDVAALKLNVDFSDAGVITGTSAARLGDLTLSNLTTTTDLNGRSVRQALAAMNSALAGIPTSDTYDALDAVANQLDAAFFAGTPSTFAQDHLQAPVPEPSSLLLLGSGVIGLVMFGQTKRG